METLGIIGAAVLAVLAVGLCLIAALMAAAFDR